MVNLDETFTHKTACSYNIAHHANPMFASNIQQYASTITNIKKSRHVSKNTQTLLHKVLNSTRNIFPHAKLIC